MLDMDKVLTNTDSLEMKAQVKYHRLITEAEEAKRAGNAKLSRSLEKKAKDFQKSFLKLAKYI